MRVVILAESAGDAEVVRILVDAILGQATEPDARVEPEHRGWGQLPTSPKSTLATDPLPPGVVVAFDIDRSRVFPRATEARQAFGRLHVLEQVVGSHRDLAAAAGQAPVRVAYLAAIPAMEAWLLAGLPGELTEADYLGLDPTRRDQAQRRELKRRKYGTSGANAPKARRAALDNAHRLAADLSVLETAFPRGFQVLADELRAWAAPTPASPS